MKELNRQIYRFDNFQLDAGNRQLGRDDKPLPLPAKAFDLLLALVENNGRLVEKDELFTSVWQDQIVEESNLTVHISQIRKALGETKKNPRFIETVPGYGYRFVGEVSNSEDEEFVIETETLSRITIEKESEKGSTAAGRFSEVESRESRVERKSESQISDLKLQIKDRRVKSNSRLFVIGGVIIATLGLSSFWLSNRNQNNSIFTP